MITFKEINKSIMEAKNIKDDLNFMDYSNSIKINNKEVLVGIKVNNRLEG